METTTHTETCCYEGCNHAATDYDADGDAACDLHAAQSERYVEIVDLGSDQWDAELAAAYEAKMREEGWDITVRGGRGGDAQGTYLVKRGGDLQILGYSVSAPESLRAAGNAAYDAVCGGWRPSAT